jgi:membrane-bound metal-dependent hydrolase YbcI (DUF457 family)
MMGRAHALSGMAAWLAGAPLLANTTGWFELDTATWLTGAVITAGAALAPDLDHPGSSSASNSLKPVTTGLASVVSIISFGHRKGTHSLLGIAAFAGLILLATGPLAPWGVLIAAFLLSAFTCKAIGFNLFKYIPIPGSQTLATVITSAAMTWIVYAVSAGNYDWFFWAAACGFAIHIIGDAITVMGVPLLWPIGKDFRLFTMRAGGATEMMVLTPVFLLLILYAGFHGMANNSVFGHPVETGGRTTGFHLPWDNPGSVEAQEESDPPAEKKKNRKKNNADT